MTKEKMRKLITACVVAATTLLVFLLGFMIYQWITIGVLNKRIAEKTSAISYYEQKAQDNADLLTYYESNMYKELESMEMGFIRQGK